MYSSVEAIEADLDRINCYAGWDRLESPRDICVLDDSLLSMSDLRRAEDCILEGRLFTEHATAGEATHLGMGSKYLFNLPAAFTLSKVASQVSREMGKPVGPEDIIALAGCSPEDLLPLHLGMRHMAQFSFDIRRLAIRRGYDPQEVLGRQHLLVVVDDVTADPILNEFQQSNFFGFNREKVLFMIQKSYFGINVVRGHLYYDGNSEERLHNHGQMAMQQTEDNEIFRIGPSGRRQPLTSAALAELLQAMDDKISYNIDDLGFLTGAIDIPVLALALMKGEEGYDMLMEIVANDPKTPQKGGMAAYDPNLCRNVVIEGLQLSRVKNSDIQFLNRNINHYLNPYNAWSRLKEEGLNIPVVVKGKHIYGKAVQGDINFMVNTEFFTRKEVKPIQALKSRANLPLAMRYMRAQDQQDGFRDYVGVLIS